MPKLKHTPKLHIYLAQKGLLHTSNMVLKEAATKDYWKNYYKNWQKEKRANQHTYRIFLTKEEQKLFMQAAIPLNLKITTLLKQSAIAYITKTGIRNNIVEFQEIKQILSSVIVPIVYALDEERMPEETANLLLERLDRIQGSIEAIAKNISTNDNKSIE